MARFLYTARDLDGETQSGEIDAVDATSARCQLSDMGWYVHTIKPAEVATDVSGVAVLSSKDAVELTAQLSHLATAGVPLSSGLRALGHDLPNSRLAHAVYRLANHLEQGMPLDQAVQMRDVRLPAYFQGLIACGLRSGQLPLVLEQFLRHERMRDDLRRRTTAALAYPAIIFAALGVWLIFVSEVLIDNFAKIFNDFDVELPQTTTNVIEAAKQTPWIVTIAIGLITLVFVSMRWFGRSRVVSELITSLPLVGPAWRDRGVFEFADRLSLLVAQSVPLPQSLELTASGLTNGAYVDAARQSAELAKAGLSLSECVDRVPIFPATLQPILAWGDRVSAPAEALRSAAEWFRTRCDLREDVLLIVIPPITFLFVTIVMTFVTTALLIPFVKLIESLT